MIFLLLALFASLTTASVTPQENIDFPVTPAAEQCLAEPRNVDELIALSRSDDSPGVLPNTVPELTGQPVSDAVAAEIGAVIVELIACQNAGEPFRAYQLYTDNYLRHVIHGLDNAALRGGATPEPPKADQWITIVAIDDIRELADGRVYATVIIDPALIPVDKIFGFILIEKDGRWLVDDVLDELEFSLP